MSDAAAKQTSEVSRRAAIPTADAAVNTLRKHFVHYNKCSVKRTQHGKSKVCFSLLQMKCFDYKKNFFYSFVTFFLKADCRLNFCVFF